MPPAADWRVEGDVIVLGALHVTVERIAASHWRADARLRSWGQAPLQPEHDAVLVPCAADECLWLGAWLEDDTAEDPAAAPPPSPAPSLGPSPGPFPARPQPGFPAAARATSAGPAPARITLDDPSSGGRAVAVLPAAYQLGTLRSAHDDPAPLQLAPPLASRRLRLELEYGPARAALELVLLPPAAWAARAQRAPPVALAAPPSLPPRLG